jgi:hypothetical protein
MSLIAALLLAGGQPQLARAGDCGWVHGRYAEANGTRVHRIYVLGTGHALNVDIPDEGVGSVPTVLQRYFKSGQFRPQRSEILADFFVCARERRIAGAMQRIALKKVRNVRIVSY